MSELWDNQLLPIEDRLEIAIGAIKFRDAQLSAMTQRAEAAEARIKASHEQEPAVVIAGVSKLAIEIADANGNDIDWSVLGVGAKFYAAPVIQPDVAELQRELEEAQCRITELEARK